MSTVAILLSAFVLSVVALLVFNDGAMPAFKAQVRERTKARGESLADDKELPQHE